MEQPKATIGSLSRPDGSAYYTQGKTTVVAGCYGPIECRQNKILIDKAQIEMHYRPKSGLPSVGDRLFETILKTTCESALLTSLYPRTSIVIIVQEMQKSGDAELIAAAINASCLALLNGGVDMNFVVGAVACYLDMDNKLALDLDVIQSNKLKATFVFVFSNVDATIITSHTTGSFTVKQYEAAVHLCQSASEAIFDYYTDVLSPHYQQND